MSFIESIKIVSSTILYSSYITIHLYIYIYISLRAYIVANTLAHKIVKLFYKNIYKSSCNRF